MVLNTHSHRVAATGAAAVLLLTLTACGGGNLGSEGTSESDFPDGPVTLTIGQDPGGSTDLIGRALAEVASDELGVPMPVVNKPGANGALAAEELAGKAADGQNLMVINASLIAITPLAVPEEDVVDINDYEVVTGISQDDYVLVANPSSGLATVQDLVDSTEPLDFATTGVGTGSQLSQELLFKQAGIEGSAVPFDGGSPAMVAVLGDQVDVASVQLGEAFAQIEAGELTPIVTFSEERNQYLPDVPTAIEEGYEVPVSQYRAVIAPKGTPDAVLDKLVEAFTAAFKDPGYQEFNENGLFTPHEISGDEVVEEWTSLLETYRSLTEEYDIDLGQVE
jgi:tripartite-type tricarboxylate transporter receptor subunit TctC